MESPSHAIRADADPLARSATSVVITLADKYTYDCPVRILIYPSGRSKFTLSSLSGVTFEDVTAERQDQTGVDVWARLSSLPSVLNSVWASVPSEVLMSSRAAGSDCGPV